MAAATPVVLAALLALPHPGPAAAGESLWTEAEFADLCHALPPGEARMREVMGDYYGLYLTEAGTGPDAMRRMDVDTARETMDRAICDGWGPLDLFTDPRFAKGGACVFFLDGEVLAQVDERYDVHSLWQVRAADVAGGGELRMAYLLLGGGHLVVAYPARATVHVHDYPVRFVRKSDRYGYARYTRMEVRAAEGERGLFRIGVRSPGNDEVAPFSGPFGARIYALRLRGDRIEPDHSLRLLNHASFPRIPIERRDGTVPDCGS